MTDISMNKKYKTRSGFEVRILATDYRSTHPVVAVVTTVNGEGIRLYYANGSYVGIEENDLDLIEVLSVNKMYVNLSNTYTNLQAAKEQGSAWPVMEISIQGNKVVGSEVVYDPGPNSWKFIL